MSRGRTGEEGPGCKAEGTSGSRRAPRGCSKAAGPVETIPRAVLRSVPAGPSTDRGGGGSCAIKLAIGLAIQIVA